MRFILSYRGLLLTLLLAFALTLYANGDDAEITDIPDDYYCCDGANILSSEVEFTIHFNTLRLRDACGAEIFVVSVTDLHGLTMDDYTYRLFNTLKAGDADKNNGFLPAMYPAPNPPEGKFRITMGIGAYDIIDDSRLSELLDDCFVELFDAGDYDGAALAIYEQMFNRVCEYYNLNLTFEIPTDLDGDYVERAALE